MKKIKIKNIGNNELESFFLDDVLAVVKQRKKERKEKKKELTK